MRTAKENDLFVSIEDILAPVLAVAFAVVLGLATLHFNPNLGVSLTAKVKNYPSHTASG